MTGKTAEPEIDVVETAVARLKPVDPSIAKTASWSDVKQTSEARAHRAEVDGW
ncbi:hypothetical protein ACWEOO_06745 [Kribbella sp. NPDC004138]